MLRTRRPPSVLAYEMFDHERTARQAQSARLLERIYHRGQSRAWDGRALLPELIEKHGPVKIAPERRAPLLRVLSSVLWGELAAWRISAELATWLEPLEAKMAATSQAHDEARHFYVLYDYLAELGSPPLRASPPAERLLEGVAGTRTLAKKLLGMQLMVEPTALTLFQSLRECDVEPVLTELMPYYERDESRHVALGVRYLPELLAKMSPAEIGDLLMWQLRHFELQIRGLKYMEDDLRALGIDPRRVFRVGRGKQLAASREMEAQLGYTLPVSGFFMRWAEFRMELDFGQGPPQRRSRRSWRRAVRVALGGLASVREDMDREQEAMRQQQVA